MVLAFLGVVISSFVSAVIMYACSMAYHGGGFESFMQSLVYASVLSATDPVSVLATFQAVPVHPDVDSVIFGEAALNDAVAIIMYRVTSSLILPGAVIDGQTVGIAIGKIVAIFFGALGIGILFGVLIAVVLKYVPFYQRGAAHEATIVVGLAYACYLFSNFFEMSGIISVMFCGIFCAEYVIPNLSHHGNESVETFLRTASLFLENMLFVYIGFGFGGTTNHDRTFDAAAIAYTFLGIVLGRAVSVAILVPLVNLTRKRGEDMFGWREMVFFVFAGLRGGIAFVLTLELRENMMLPEYFRQLSLGTTLMICFISVVFIGGGTARVMKLLGIEYKPEEPAGLETDMDEKKAVDDTLYPTGDRAFSPESEFKLDDLYSKLKRRFLGPLLIRNYSFPKESAETKDAAGVESETSSFTAEPSATYVGLTGTGVDSFEPITTSSLAFDDGPSRARGRSQERRRSTSLARHRRIILTGAPEDLMAQTERLHRHENAEDWMALERGNRVPHPRRGTLSTLPPLAPVHESDRKIDSSDTV